MGFRSLFLNLLKQEQKRYNIIQDFYQYLRSLLPCLGEGRCYKRIDVFIFFYKLGKSYRLLAIIRFYVFSVPPIDILSLRLLFC